MRQLTPPTNLVLALVFAGLVLLALDLPFYAASPAPDPNSTDGPVERGAGAIARWFTSDRTAVSGSEAMDAAQLMLMGLSAITAGLAALMALPVLRGAVRDILKVVPLVAPFVVFVQLFNAPDGMEIRYGIFVTLALALLMANSAFHGAELRSAASSARPLHPAGGPGGPPGVR